MAKPSHVSPVTSWGLVQSLQTDTGPIAAAPSPIPTTSSLNGDYFQHHGALQMSNLRGLDDLGGLYEAKVFTRLDIVVHFQ